MDYFTYCICISRMTSAKFSIYVQRELACCVYNIRSKKVVVLGMGGVCGTERTSRRKQLSKKKNAKSASHKQKARKKQKNTHATSRKQKRTLRNLKFLPSIWHKE